MFLITVTCPGHIIRNTHTHALLKVSLIAFSGLWTFTFKHDFPLLILSNFIYCQHDHTGFKWIDNLSNKNLFTKAIQIFKSLVN